MNFPLDYGSVYRNWSIYTNSIYYRYILPSRFKHCILIFENFYICDPQFFPLVNHAPYMYLPVQLYNPHIIGTCTPPCKQKNLGCQNKSCV